ncbi:MAG: UDP-N-acetylmuramoyl-tripeptide--D-alanyl-D-alanine ligase [Bacteroidota bacterium]|nr:UDP-N-acetylmuramoyl-tripeptide--D-alanyl-D-alanine ligase [Bacteroidota bacterium]
MIGFRVHDLLRLPHVFAHGVDDILGRAIRGVCTDSRVIRSGEVFLALRGERFDGHDFIPQAVAGGALLCVIDVRASQTLGATLSTPHIVVRDTLRAYGDIAREYRLRFAVPVLAITGSNGKTGTKDLSSTVLATSYRVLKTEGNLNNRVGVPKMLLRLRPRHEVVVLELGTNMPGDIPELCRICEPTHGLITNIGWAHTERLLSREGIAAEKGTLFRSLPRNGVAFSNADEPLLRRHLRRTTERVSFGFRRGADVRITHVELDEEARAFVHIDAPEFESSPVRFRMRIRGRHAAYTAAAALAIGWVFGCRTGDMITAIQRHTPFRGRMRVRQAGGIRVIDDSYNANPDSTIAALETLAAMKARGRRIAVLGDMLELGKGAQEAHRLVGSRAAALGIPIIFTLGSLARSIAEAAAENGAVCRRFTDQGELEREIVRTIRPGDVVLVKGSRAMGMEHVVSALLRGAAPTEENI